MKKLTLIALLIATFNINAKEVCGTEDRSGAIPCYDIVDSTLEKRGKYVEFIANPYNKINNNKDRYPKESLGVICDKKQIAIIAIGDVTQNIEYVDQSTELDRQVIAYVCNYAKKLPNTPFEVSDDH